MVDASYLSSKLTILAVLGLVLIVAPNFNVFSKILNISYWFLTLPVHSPMFFISFMAAGLAITYKFVTLKQEIADVKSLLTLSDAEKDKLIISNEALTRKIGAYELMIHRNQNPDPLNAIGRRVIDRIRALPQNNVMIIKNTDEVLPLNDNPLVVPIEFPITRPGEVYEANDQLFVVGIRYGAHFSPELHGLMTRNYRVHRALTSAIKRVLMPRFGELMDSLPLVHHYLGDPRIGRGLFMESAQSLVTVASGPETGPMFEED